MKESIEAPLLKTILVVPLLILLTFSALIAILTINYNHKQLEYEIIRIKNDYIQIHKNIIKKEVYKIYNLISYSSKKENFVVSKNFSEETMKKIALNRINSLKYDKEGYIFILDYEGNFLLNPSKKLIEKNQINLKDKEGLPLIKKIIEIAQKGEDYLSYTSLPGTYYSQTEKISFIKSFEPWKWIIGYGFYPNNVQPYIEERLSMLKNTHKKFVEKILLINFTLTILLSLAIIFFSNNIKSIFFKYKNIIKKKEMKNRKKDEIIYHQSKMATIGELLNIISHQWRQPLNQINSLTLDTFIEQRNGTLNYDNLTKNINEIENITEYLSRTIDDFSNFFIMEKNKTPFLVNESIQGCIELLSPSLKDVNIDRNYQSQKNILGFNTLFQQVILTIITNSLDAFNINNIDQRFILISTYDKENFTYIKICDNAGGIEDIHLDKIFNLYYSTKEKNTPSGLGLYIAKRIIEKNMYGRIYVTNSSQGVEFLIEVTNDGS